MFVNLEICPKAFEPLTLDEKPNRRTVRLVTTADSGKMYGDLIFQFHGASFKLKADASIYPSEQCTADMNKNFKPVAESKCVRESFDDEKKTGSYLISFLKYPTYPLENNIYFHNGNPDINKFFCNVSRVDLEEIQNLNCLIEDVTTDNLPGERHF